MSEKNLKLANAALGLVVAYDDLMRQYTGPISDISEADNAAIDEAYDQMVFAARTTLDVVSRPSPQDRGEAAPIRDEHGKFDHRGRKGFITGCPCLPCLTAAAFWMWRPSTSLVSGERRVRGSCVTVNGHHYGSSELEDGNNVFVCLDPDAPARLLVYSIARDVFICEALCPELLPRMEGGSTPAVFDQSPQATEQPEERHPPEEETTSTSALPQTSCSLEDRSGDTGREQQAHAVSYSAWTSSDNITSEPQGGVE